MKKQKTLSALAAVVIAAANLSADEAPARENEARPDKTAAAQERQQPTAIVDVAPVAQVDDTSIRRYTGQLLSPAVVNVIAQVPGEIVEVGFADGAEITAGQMLYRLSDVQYRAAAKNAEANLASARAKLEYARTNFERINSLYKQSAASLDTMESAKSVLASSEAAVLAAEAQLITAEDNLSKTTIIAPTDGIAGVTAFTRGNYVTPSSGTLVTVVAIRPMRVKFALSTADYLSMFGNLENLKDNAVIQLTLADGSPCADAGKVEFLDNTANSRTDSVMVYALFPNADGRLVAGSTVTVTLSKRRGITVSAIPLSAVLLDRGGAAVYVVNAEGAAEKRRVVLGAIAGGLQTVSSGLEPGEIVVVNGTHKVVEGCKVIPSAAARAAAKEN